MEGQKGFPGAFGAGGEDDGGGCAGGERDRLGGGADGDSAGRFRTAGGAKFNLPGAGEGGGVLAEDLGVEGVRLVGEARGFRLQHQVFFHDDGRLGVTESSRVLVGDGDEAVAGERVGKLEGVAEFPGGIGDERGCPGGAGIEILPQEIGEFTEVGAAADEESFAREVLLFWVFGDEGLEGRAGLHVKVAGCVKVVHGLGRLVAHDGERAFVFGVKGDLGARSGLAVGEGDAAAQCDFVAGAVGRRGCFEVHGEFVSEVFHDEFAIAEAELGLLELAGGLLRAFDDEDGDEGVRCVIGGEWNFDHWVVGLELDGEGAEDFFAFHGD